MKLPPSLDIYYSRALERSLKDIDLTCPQVETARHKAELALLKGMGKRLRTSGYSEEEVIAILEHLAQVANQALETCEQAIKRVTYRFRDRLIRTHCKLLRATRTKPQPPL